MSRDAPETRRSPWLCALPGFAGAVLAWLAFEAVRSEFLDGLSMGLGAYQMPSPSSLAAIAVTTAFSGAAAVGLTHAGWHLLTPARREAIRVALDRASDLQWMVLCSVVATMLAAQARTWVLDSGPLSDDESAYELASRILLLGRVWVPSPSDAIFFDNVFLVNDGRLYAQYPLGWPALMAPFTALGIAGYANAFYSGLTVPAVFLAARELLGLREARLASALYVLSPMHVLAAATEMSHTSCTLAIAWLLVSVLWTRRDGSPVWLNAVVAFAFGVAFHIRPSVAVGAGGPLLVLWAHGLVGRPGALRAFLAFALPSLVLGAAFFLVNFAQTGRATTMAYIRTLEFIEETHYRYTSVMPSEGRLPNLEFSAPARRLAILAAALFRLDHDLLAWPATLVLLPLAWARRSLLPVWASAAGMLGVHAFSANVGIDGFAPVHFFELGVPALLLLSAAVSAVSEWLRALSPERAHLPLLAVGALTVSALGIALPPRIASLAAVAEGVNYPRHALERMGIHNALVFAAQPFVMRCPSRPDLPAVFFRPNNPPSLDADVVWVNHVTIEEDRRFAARFPERDARLMLWTEDCRIAFVPIMVPDIDGVPPARNLPPELSAPSGERRRSD